MLPNPEPGTPDPTDLLTVLKRRRDKARTGEKPRPARALSIARWLGVREHGSDDSRKRGVRLLVDELRKAGQPIVADFDGYRLAVTPEDLAAYRDFRHRSGLHDLVDASAAVKGPAAADLTGQLALFPPSGGRAAVV